jgi:ABC-type branched-subunit amino acid transport system substrate-binding protein
MRPCRTHNRASLLLQLKTLAWCVLLLGLFAASAPTQTQTDAAATKPYATLDRQSVAYRGPVPLTEKESSDGTAVIGMILPLKGRQQSEGKALLAAAQQAIEEEQSRGPLPDGRRLDLVARDESGPWGQASTEILKLFDQDHALAILTSANGTSAHLAEQIANKIGIPILTLSSDPSTTQANVPWLFRLGPSDTDQARSFCQRIYSDFGFQKVLLVVQMDHDGRVGGAEFEKAAHALKATTPIRFELTDSAPDLESLREILQTKEPDAIVIWTDAPLADELLPLVRSTRPSTPVFLCRKAAQLDATGIRDVAEIAPRQRVRSLGELFTVGSSQLGQSAAQSKFQQLYFVRTGTNPGFAADEIYQAVHLLAAALRTTGANRVLLRDYLASEGKSRDATGSVPFDPAGNNRQEFSVVNLQTIALATP